MRNTSKIKKLSSIMHVFCTSLMFLLPLGIIWIWVNFNNYALSLARPNLLIDPQYIQTYQIIMACTLQLLAASIMIYGIWHLRALFKLFHSGVFFTHKAIQHLNKFTLALFVSTLLKPIVLAILSVLLTWGNPPGKKSLVLEIGSSEIATIFVAGILLTIIWIMREGQQLENENKSFI